MERGAHLRGPVWRQRGGEEKRASVIDQTVFEGGAAADEGSGAGQGFAAGVNHGDDVIARVAASDRVAIVREDAAAAGAVDRGGVGFVEDYACTVAGGQRENFWKWGDVAVHAEDGFGDDKFAAAMVLLLAQRGFQCVEI